MVEIGFKWSIHEEYSFDFQLHYPMWMRIRFLDNRRWGLKSVGDFTMKNNWRFTDRTTGKEEKEIIDIFKRFEFRFLKAKNFKVSEWFCLKRVENTFRMLSVQKEDSESAFFTFFPSRFVTRDFMQNFQNKIRKFFWFQAEMSDEIFRRWESITVHRIGLRHVIPVSALSTPRLWPLERKSSSIKSPVETRSPKIG